MYSGCRCACNKTVQTCDTSVFQQEKVSFHLALFPHKIFSICCLVCFLIKAINIPYKENYAFNPLTPMCDQDRISPHNILCNINQISDYDEKKEKYPFGDN